MYNLCTIILQSIYKGGVIANVDLGSASLSRRCSCCCTEQASGVLQFNFPPVHIRSIRRTVSETTNVLKPVYLSLT